MNRMNILFRMLDIIVIIELAIAGCINMAELAAWWSDGGNDDGGCCNFPYA